MFGNIIVDFSECFFDYVNFVDIWVKYSVVRLYLVVGVVGVVVLIGWCGEFWVILDGDIKNVFWFDVILVICDFIF